MFSIGTRLGRGARSRGLRHGIRPRSGLRLIRSISSPVGGRILPWGRPRSPGLAICGLPAWWALKPSSRNLNEGIWRTTVRPQWGYRKVDSLRHSEIQAWVSSLDYSPSWVRHCHSVLAQVLDVAVRDKMIRSNPARGVRLPRKVKTVKVYYTIEQLTTLANASSKYREIIYTLGTVGLRWGELAALRPMDLDPLRGRISVDRNAVRMNSDMIIGTPKAHERRRVAAPKFVMDMLIEQSQGVASDGLLWPAKDGRPMKSPGRRSWFEGAMSRAMENDPAMARVTPHGLRHVAAGLLVQSGANVKAVQHQLGHKDASETLNTYAELFDDGLADVAEALDSMWAGTGHRGNVVDMGL